MPAAGITKPDTKMILTLLIKQQENLEADAKNRFGARKFHVQLREIPTCQVSFFAMKVFEQRYCLVCDSSESNFTVAY